MIIEVEMVNGKLVYRPITLMNLKKRAKKLEERITILNERRKKDRGYSGNRTNEQRILKATGRLKATLAEIEKTKSNILPHKISIPAHCNDCDLTNYCPLCGQYSAGIDYFERHGFCEVCNEEAYGELGSDDEEG